MKMTPLWLASAILLGGCADLNGLAPQGRLRPEQDIAARASLAGVQPAPWPNSDWWRTLGDGALDTLIGEALRDNPDLAAAGARVRHEEIADLAHAYPREANAAILDWFLGAPG